MIPSEFINQIICGEASQVLQTLPSKSIDLVVTSPPYDNLRSYKGYAFNFEKIAQQLYRVLKKGGVIVWVVGDATINGSETGTSLRQALYFKELGLNLHDTMIFVKDSFQKPCINRYWSCFEYMFVLSKGRPCTHHLLQDRLNSQQGKTVTRKTVRNAEGSVSPRRNVQIAPYGKRTNLWSYSVGYMKGTNDKTAYAHPATFPEELAQDHILSWSNEGELVLDPFCGSGTTCKMAKILRRNYLGIDISPEYCALAQTRVEQVSPALRWRIKLH